MGDAAVNIKEPPKSRAMVRATAAQLAILRNAYELLSSPSSEQRKGLSEQTGLPPKWIGQWFCRQRNRGRTGGLNNKRKFHIFTAETSSPAPEPIFTPVPSASCSTDPATVELCQGNKDIKLEYIESAVLSSLSGNGESTHSLTDGSEFGGSMTSFGGHVDHNDVSLITDSGKRKSRSVASQQRKGGTTAVTTTYTEHAHANGQGMDDLNCPTFLSNQHIDGHTASPTAYTQLPHEDSEQLNPIVNLQETFLMSIIPPRRSTTVAWNATRSDDAKNVAAMRNRSSRLSVVSLPVDRLVEGPSESIHQHVVPQPYAVQLSREAHSTHKTAASSLPVPPSQWENNEPRKRSQPQSERLAWMTDAVALVPDSNRTLTSYPTALSCFPSVVPSTNADSPAFFMTRLDFSSSPLKENYFSSVTGLESEIMASNFQQEMKTENYPETQEPILYERIDVLDPSRAPLKHLTGILGDFVSGDGSYRRLLVDAELRRKLVVRLTNEELLLQNPFMGAMGLSLLSRLGLL